jgi:acetyl esterase/lipase
MIREKYLDRYSLDKQVSRFTPPTFIAHCSDDSIVPVENSLRYYNRLVDVGVPAEMHIWPTGGHGWGFSSEKFVGKGKDRFAYARDAFEASLERWLKALR